ncbi:MAG: CHAD domain-containing protein [Desulfobacterales bacterium]|nr:CHAD domain-containing protein [Desulfobacterales bacterium]MBI5897139.1 CHAD domain-containing protein [Desulfobacterales bacterium]
MKLEAQFRLAPEMSAQQAARTILGHLTAVMRVNEAGIRQDSDIECLHDFRVAARRSRSLLTLLKKEFDPAQRAELSAGLRVLGQSTNALRDLDVYLAQRARYQKILPAALRPAIAPWFDALGRQRGREAKKVARFLSSRPYGRIMERLESFATAGPDPDTVKPVEASGDTPIVAVARREIDRLFAKALRVGRRIDASSADDRLHRLRIQCKQLRYALEFFHGLFAPGPVGQAIRQVKSLQEYLGLFNDRSVQQRFLFDHLKGIPAPHGPRRMARAAAVGALIGVLFMEKEHQRAGFEAVFTRFSDPEQVRRLRKLFSPAED